MVINRQRIMSWNVGIIKKRLNSDSTILLQDHWEGEKLIHWLHERCGKSEKAHAVMKDDLAGGKPR